MNRFFRTMAAAAAAAVLTLAAPAVPAAAQAPRPVQSHAAATAAGPVTAMTTGNRPVQPRAAAALGCVTTVTDTEAHFGWYFRSTHTVCLTPDQQSDCLTVENISTAGAPTVVLLPPKCRYGRLR